MLPEQAAAMELNASVTSVTIASPPVVNFKIVNQAGVPITGLALPTKASSATVPRYQNVAFTLAKLVPGSTGATSSVAGPSKWVSYLVTSVPNVATPTVTAARPTSDNNGTLVDNGDGTYKYTFFRDITKVKADVAAMTLTGLNVAADLGDLTYDPNAVHRLVLQISGNVPGTGTNTANETQVVPAVPFAKPANVVFDFIPATGQVLTAADPGQRLIVDKLSCNECHGKLGGIPGTESAGFHSGSRYDPRYCVTCHTDQRKYGQKRVVSTNGSFPVKADGKTPADNTYVADGVTVGDFPVLIHRVHKGEMLVKKAYNYAGVQLNETLFPQDIRNCSKCHDNTAPKAAPQAANFKTVPSRLACGACHDGIDWATGNGVTNAAANQAELEGTTPAATGHKGGAQADDSLCGLCHRPDAIEKVYHVAVTPPNPGNSLLLGQSNDNTNAAWIASKLDNLPAGAVQVTYDVKSVSRDATTGNPKIEFRFLQNGRRADFNAFAATLPSAATGQKEMWPDYMGSPSVYFVFAVPQDGVTAPTDFNASLNGYIRNIWNGTATGTGAGTMTGPDTSGYYTITLTGVTVPANAVMLTGGIGYSYGVKNTLPLTQTNLADTSLLDPKRSPRFATSLPTTTATLTATNSNRVGGLIVVSPDVQKVATGYTGRRAIVDDKRCNACHEELGAFTLEAFHAGQRNDGATCSWCHTPNRTSSGWSADSTAFVHAIHAASKRTRDYNWHAVSADKTFGKIGYPGVLNRCETCHVPGSYDFTAADSAAQANGRLVRTDAAGTVADNISRSPLAPAAAYGKAPTYSGSLTGGSLDVSGAATNLVSTPTAAVCFACHDSSAAQAHMEGNGGAIYKARSTVVGVKQEGCLACHGSGAIADIKAVHAK